MKRNRIFGFGTSLTVEARSVALEPSVVAEVGRVPGWRCVEEDAHGAEVNDAEARPKVEYVGVRWVTRVGKLRR